MFDLTNSQKTFYYLDQYVGDAVTSLCWTIFFENFNNIDQFNEVLNCLVKYNDALRIRILPDGPQQYFEEFYEQVFPVLYFENKESLDLYAKVFAKKSISITDQLFSFAIISVGDSVGLLMKIHHIISDATGIMLLNQQLSFMLNHKNVQIYSYKEYIIHAKSDDKIREKNTKYFLNAFNECRPRKCIFNNDRISYGSNRLQYDIDPDLAELLRSYSKNNRIPLYCLFLASLCDYVGEPISVGITNRNRVGYKSKKTVGLFVNTLPLIIEPGSDFQKNAEDIQCRIFEAIKHSDYDHHKLLKDLSGEPVYDVIFDYEQVDYNDPALDWCWYPCGAQSESLQIHIAEYTKTGRILIIYDYQTDVFSESRINEINRTILNLLAAGINNPNRPRIAHDHSGRTVACPQGSVYSLFEEQAKNGAGRIISKECTFSNNDLKRNAEKIDAAIRGEKRVIGIICDRSFEQLSAIYGVIRGGNAYLPISSDCPIERIRTMLAQSRCETVLVQKRYRNILPDAIIIEDILAKPPIRPVMPCNAVPEDILYVMFTSGSTGTPKGVMVSNKSIVNRIQWMIQTYFNHETIVMVKTPYTFDVSAWEIFGFALGGFSIYILPAEDHYRQNRIAEDIISKGITDIHFVPAVFEQFLRTSSSNYPSLKNIFLSGERLTASLVNLAPAPVHNLYGPTECSVDVTAYDCENVEMDPVPIGKPIDNCQIYVLNQLMQKMPVGTVGQICIGGMCVGKGYINDPVRTDEFFVDNPFDEGKLYLTGDLGYWREDGNLIYVGRSDQQVKINGQRIELGEIEVAMSALVPSVAVIVKNNRLIAYYTGAKRDDLRDKLGDMLPRYMIPHSFIHTEDIPLIPSGKINRQALPYEAPISILEEEIYNAFHRLLTVTQVSRTDDIYSLGGTSLDIMTLLTEEPLNRLSPSDFMSDPTPAGLAAKLCDADGDAVLVALYKPKNAVRAYVLFPYGGGDASAFSALVSEFRRRNAPVALYCVPWLDRYEDAAKEVKALSEQMELYFYSHCAGVSVAMQLIDLLNTEKPVIKKLIAAATIPPTKHSVNFWPWLSNKVIISFLHKAGLPDVGLEKEDEIVCSFRRNVDYYFQFFAQKCKKTPCQVEIMISRNDPFTPNIRTARKRWDRYVTNLEKIHVFNWESHYFQSSSADILADIMLNEGEYSYATES